MFRHSEAVYVKCRYYEKFFTDTEVFTLVTFIVIYQLSKVDAFHVEYQVTIFRDFLSADTIIYHYQVTITDIKVFTLAKFIVIYQLSKVDAFHVEY